MWSTGARDQPSRAETSRDETDETPGTLTMTKIMHSIAGSTNALTKVMMIDAKRRTVAMTRTGLNIVWSCFLKPLYSRALARRAVRA
jgi:hypothetical protein